MPRLPIVAVVALSCVAVACTTYRPAPLDDASVAKALTPPTAAALRIEAAKIHHPLLRPVTLDLSDGIGPDEAAVLAVLVHPSLRAERDRRQLAEAQLVQAGILPNPQLSYSTDFVTGGNTAGTFTGFGFGASWDLAALVTHSADVDSARAEARSIDLDVAWREWQVAQAAVLALYRLAALEAEVEAAHAAASTLTDNAVTLKRAASQHLVSVLDAAAADAAAQDAYATALSLEQERNAQRLALNRALGLPAGTEVRVAAASTALPLHVEIPKEAELLDGLEQRRLDLMALRAGYDSQEAKVRAAVLAQFPKIGLGFNQARDTSNVWTTGFGITLDLPIFDRNQGVIAVERATRQSLFDEYATRVFEARSDIAVALSDIRSLNEQVAAAQSALPVLERLVTTARAALDEGNADVLGFYRARNDLIQKRIQALKLRESLAEARIALEIAAGRHQTEEDSK